MDDAADREYAHAPEFQDVIDLCRELNTAQVRYVLIGGFAVILHGSVRGTKDIDLLVDASEENVRAIKKAMATLPDNAAALIADDDVQKHQVVRIGDVFVVDLMGAACGIDYPEAIAAGIEWKEIDGVRIPFASKALLIRMKDTFRDSDKSDINFLQMKIAEESKVKK